jgi:hypothetical protein
MRLSFRRSQQSGNVSSLANVISENTAEKQAEKPEGFKSALAYKWSGFLAESCSLERTGRRLIQVSNIPGICLK